MSWIGLDERTEQRGAELVATLYHSHIVEMHRQSAQLRIEALDGAFERIDGEYDASVRFGEIIGAQAPLPVVE